MSAKWDYRQYQKYLEMKKELAGKRYLVFAYGSNMNQQQIKFRAPSAINLGIGTVKGYEFRFVGRGVATIVQKPKSEVPGVLYSIDFEDFESMHVFEGVPFVYECKLRPISTKNGTKVAWTYIHNSTEFSRPSEQYFFKIAEGLEHNKLTDEHIWKAYETAVQETKDKPISEFSSYAAYFSKWGDD